MSQIIHRILKKLGDFELLETLAHRLAPTELQSLLLEVYRRQAAGIEPAMLLKAYERDRFVKPCHVDPLLMVEIDRLAFSLLPENFQALELSPVCPLGSSSAIATVNQDKVLTTSRNTEVLADATNVLALECALRRREAMRTSPRSPQRINLAASHRHLRTPVPEVAWFAPHFRIFCLCSAGRAQPSFQFETDSLRDQLDFYLSLLARIGEVGLTISAVQICLTDLDNGRNQERVDARVIGPLSQKYPEVEFLWDKQRKRGLNYYRNVCFSIWIAEKRGTSYDLGDGGFVDWTAQLLSNRKERLLIGAIGTQTMATLFNQLSDQA